MNKILLFSAVLIFSISCATRKIQINKKVEPIGKEQKTLQHSFYLVGDSGENKNLLDQLNEQLKKSSKNTSTLFLGNNAYSNKQILNREDIFDNQLNVLDNYQGKAIFIPGSYEWDEGIKKLKNHQKTVEKKIGKHSFEPRNACPISDIEINENTVVIAVDSEWYFEDWDGHATINDNCEIKNRKMFFDEFESLIKKNIGKTTIIAIHRPMYSEGIYGGKSTLAQQLYPVPVLGHAIRKTGGVFSSDLQNKRYLEFKHRMVTLAQHNPKVIFVSGHEQSLQYIEEDNLAQIISGSGGVKSTATKKNKALFSYGTNGFAKLDIYTNGSSVVHFYAMKNKVAKEVFSYEIYAADVLNKNKKSYNNNFPKEKTAQIYTDKEVKSSVAQRFFWGERYRKYYGTKVTSPTVNLDTLYGGLTPVRKGGGHQSKSLRLENKEGKQYVMRALRKSGTKYLQAVAFKEQYVEGQYDKSGLERLVLDVFTGSHPYAPFTIGTLSDAVGVYHTNPVLYYVPKQNKLGVFNDEFGDELYMIEERTSSNHEEVDSFGNASKIISTGDMYKNIRKNSKYYIDQESYIKARLFDMLIGDWDRHGDQWRWAEFKDDKGIKFYRPIPRDRDQAFSIMDDGFFLGAATKIIPTARLLRSYSEDLKSPKWMNPEPFPLDVTLTAESNEAAWIKQAIYIQEHLSDESIDNAFTFFPDEVNDETVKEIKRKLKGRRKNLKTIAKKYYKHLSKYAVVTGTDKDNVFDLERFPGGITKLKAYAVKDNVKRKLIFEKEYNRKETREIWVYGLDDKDKFIVHGKGNKCIPLRIMGGQGKDTYDIQNGNKVAIYDFKSKKSEFLTKKGIIKLKDNYKTNIYDYSKIENNTNAVTPTLGYNPDDGLKVGLSETYIINGFERNPFTQKHHISGAYYFGTKGYEIDYNGEIANMLGKFNLGLDVSFQSPNYSTNFFGLGNGTENFEPDNDDLDLDFNRVKIERFEFKPSLIYKGKLGSEFKISASYEINKVEETEGRFVTISNELTNSIFDSQNFLGTEVEYFFENKDNKSFTTLGLNTSLLAGFKTSLDKSNHSFGYIIPSLALDYKVDKHGNVVFATKLKGHVNFGNNFEFYQGASIGGTDGLRGFRNQRFIGKESFYQNTDLRLNVIKLKTHVIPVKIGLFGSFDYGRVWSDFDISDKWNTSYGGGFWFDGASLFTANFGIFSSGEDSRFSFGLGFGFN